MPPAPKCVPKFTRSAEPSFRIRKGRPRSVLLRLDWMPSPQGAFGLGPWLSKRRDASLISRFSRPAESASTPHGEGCLRVTTKDPHRAADGTLRVRIITAGGLPPRYRASREGYHPGLVGAERVRPRVDHDRPLHGRCAAHGVALFTGRIRRQTKCVILDP